jgi:transposase
MFINTMKQTKKDGTLSWKIQICESFRVGNKVTRKVVRHVGMAHRQEELERFQRLAAALLESELAHKQNSALLFDASDDVESQLKVTPRHFISEDIIEESRTIEGPQEIYGSLFDELGLGTILAGPHSEVLKNVVLARATEPASKRKTQETLERDMGFTVSLDRIYRMMTALADKQDEVTKVVFSQTASLFENKIDVVFFDVTTLYFESIQNDELRAFGYSKDQKFHSVQVVLALATTSEGLPVGYKLFPGNTAETKTLISCLDEWRKHIDIGHVVFVADRGMFNSSNLFELQNSGYEFIVAAKLRGMNAATKEIVLSEAGYRCSAVENDTIPSWVKEIPHVVEHKFKDTMDKWQTEQVKGRLLCTYNRGRAVKDSGDRARILEKMQKLLSTKDGTKSDAGKLVSNSGYKKYALLEGRKLASIDNKKVEKDAQWDGMHGIFTNSDRNTCEILARYRGLWSIEATFRVCKHDLEMRPIYHFTPKKVQAHIAICYLALTITRHLEHRLRKDGIKLSPERIKEELSRVQSSKILDKATGQRYRLPSRISEVAQRIYAVLKIERKLALSKSK